VIRYRPYLGRKKVNGKRFHQSLPTTACRQANDIVIVRYFPPPLAPYM
jgi:hypothetical protein